MRFVFFSYCYPPLLYPRSIQVARLARHSTPDNVEVIAAADDEPDDPGLLTTTSSRVEVTRLPWGRRASLARKARARLLKDRFLLPDHFRAWASDAARWVIGNSSLSPQDVLVSFGAPMSDHLAAATIVKRTGVRWVAHFSDPWVDNPYRRANRLDAKLANRLESKLNARYEAATARGADGLIFTSEQTASLVMSKYPKTWRRKVAVVPPAFDAELFPSVESPSQDRPLIARYVGAFYRHRGPEPLFKALALLRERGSPALEGLRIELVGAFAEDPRAAPSGSRLAPGLLTVRPPVPYLESLALMRDADLLLLIDAAAETSVFFPSKLADYLGARRPILAVTPPGVAADVVAGAGGWQADPCDPEAVATALTSALDHARKHRGDLWGREAFLSQFSAPIVARRFDEHIAAVLQPGASPGRPRD